jgi:hypothetical protein
MTSLTGKSIVIISSFLTIIILISGCVVDNNQQPETEQHFTSVPSSGSSTSETETPNSIDQATEIIKTFMRPQEINNLTYVRSFNKSNQVLYEFQTVNSTFNVNFATGRVQLANWMGSGPVISGISSDINQSCKVVGEFVREKYPELWVSNDSQDMDLKSAKKWPLSIETKYECTWFETLYSPDKTKIPHYEISSRNSVDVVLDPLTGMILSYEETFVPLNPTLNLKPTLSEEQAKILAQQYFVENAEIDGSLPSNQTCYGLGISTDENGNQYLVWILEVEQYRSALFGGLIGIDAHDGHVVYHATF